MMQLLQRTALAFAVTAAVSNAASSNGCTGSHPLPSGLTPGGQSQNITIKSHGVNRTYLIHLPKNYTATSPVPLFFSFAGATKNASEQEGLSQFSNPEFNPSGIAIYPQSLNGEHWLGSPGVSLSSPNDIDFVLDLLTSLKNNYCIDTNRVYSAGKSQGGGMTNLLACNATAAAQFAAFASVSGAYYENVLATTDCNPGRSKVPFLEFHGLNDTVVPYAGKNPSGGQPTDEPYIPDFMQQWVQRNGCTGSQTNATVTPGLYPGGLVTHYNWSCGTGKANIVQHYRENNLGHVWPSTVPNDDCPDKSSSCPLGHYTFNASSVIMDFFSQWTLPE